MTDLWSFNTGKVQAKIGVNEKAMSDKSPVSFALLDNHRLKANEDMPQARFMVEIPLLNSPQVNGINFPNFMPLGVQGIGSFMKWL